MIDPLFRIEPLEPNVTKVVLNDLVLFYSYKTVIGFRYKEDEHWLQGDWSHTTCKHLKSLGAPKDEDRTPPPEFKVALLRALQENARKLPREVVPFLSYARNDLKKAQKERKAAEARRKKNRQAFDARKKEERKLRAKGKEAYIKGLDPTGQRIAEVLSKKKTRDQAWKILIKEFPVLPFSRVQEIAETLKTFR